MARFLTQKGQGMVGVLVSGALLILMLGAVFQVLDRTYSSQKGIAVSGEVSDYLVGLNQILGDKNSCKAALAGQQLMNAGYGCTNGSGELTTINWEGRPYLQVNAVKKGLKATKLCVKKLDDSWQLYG